MGDYVVLQPIHLGSSEKGQRRKQALEALAAEAECFWNNEPSIGRWLIALADEFIIRKENAMADWRICSKCGEEYDANSENHECDPRSVKWSEAADEEIERQKNDKSEEKK